MAYRTDGRCGSAYGDALCDPSRSGSCCSYSGFCGNTAAYCTEGPSGCQSGCSPGNSTTTPTPSPAPPISSSSLTTGAKAGIIGGVIGFAALVVVLLYFLLRHRKEQETSRQLATHPAPPGPTTTNVNFVVTDANTIQRVLQQNPHLIANGTPANRLAIGGTQAQYLTQGGLVYDASDVAASDRGHQRSSRNRSIRRWLGHS